MVFLTMVLDFVKSGPCVSYLLRKRALYNDMSRYFQRIFVILPLDKVCAMADPFD